MSVELDRSPRRWGQMLRTRESQEFELSLYVSNTLADIVVIALITSLQLENRPPLLALCL